MAELSDIQNELVRNEIEEFIEKEAERRHIIQMYARAKPAMQDIAAAIIEGDHGASDRLTRAALGLIALALSVLLPADPAKAEKLILLLDWFLNPDHAPLVVAEEKGFFAAAGLEVEMIEPADPNDPPKMVAAGKDSGLWLLRSAEGAWSRTRIDADSKGFEHATILADLDGDGRDELYTASDDHGEVRRYVWMGDGFGREVIYRRPGGGGAALTWNLMPLPVALIP